MANAAVPSGRSATSIGRRDFWCLVQALLLLLYAHGFALGATTQDAGLCTATAPAQMAPVFAALESGGDPNGTADRGITLLELATNWNCAEEVRQLLARGADPNRCSEAGPCALYLAAGRDTRILKMLVDAGADVNAETKQFSYTPLGMVANSKPYTFTQLIEKGGYRGPVPNSLESARILIAAGANVSHVNGSSESPLRTAIRVDNLPIARLLLEAGADVHQGLPATAGYNAGNTILMNAIEVYLVHGEISALSLLFEFGANANDRNMSTYSAACEKRRGGCEWRGYSAIGFAAKEGITEIVKILLEHGADPRVGRSDGKSALELAEERGQSATVELLRQHLAK